MYVFTTQFWREIWIHTFLNKNELGIWNFNLEQTLLLIHFDLYLLTFPSFIIALKDTRPKGVVLNGRLRMYCFSCHFHTRWWKKPAHVAITREKSWRRCEFCGLFTCSVQGLLDLRGFDLRGFVLRGFLKGFYSSIYAVLFLDLRGFWEQNSTLYIKYWF